MRRLCHEMMLSCSDAQHQNPALGSGPENQRRHHCQYTGDDCLHVLSMPGRDRIVVNGAAPMSYQTLLTHQLSRSSLGSMHN